MSDTYNAVFLTNSDNTGEEYANTFVAAPPPVPSDFEIDSSVSLTTGTPSKTLNITRVTGTGAFTAISSDTNVVTCTVAGDTLTLNGQATGSATVTVTMAADGNYLECVKEVSVSVSIVELVSWSSGTDEQIAAMVAAADAGEIDLYEDAGWRVGDERSVSLAAIASSGTYDGVSWSVGESQSAQTVTMVLMHQGSYQLVTPVKDTSGQNRTTCSFVVGMKNCLATTGYMNRTNTNSGSWNSCARRNWCNGGFRQAVNSTLRPIFKQFNCITGVWNGNTTGGSNLTTQDYFALPAGKEVLGGGSSTSYSTNNEANALIQFTWYATSSNRIKQVNGSTGLWWERSPQYSNSSNFCRVASNGGAGGTGASIANGLAPFGCI